MRDHYYSVADFSFAVSLPDERDPHAWLPNFRPFAAAPTDDALLFRLAVDDEAEQPAGGALLEEDVNDMGRVRLYAMPSGDYRVEVEFLGASHSFVASPDFSRLRAMVRWDVPGAASSLSSMLRIAFSQAVLPRGGVSVHASAVVCDARAYLFLGPSGTGKSTHARFWLERFAGSELLNDDNPAFRLFADGRIRVYGTPWSGKTPCYKALSAPLGGIVRLRQAPYDRFTPLEGVAAFSAVYSSCSAVHRDDALHDSLCDTLAGVVARVPVGTLQCLPHVEAALVARAGLGTPTTAD